MICSDDRRKPTAGDLHEVRRFADLLHRLGPVERDELGRPVYTAAQLDALADFHDDGDPELAGLVARLRAAAQRRRPASFRSGT